MFIYVLIDSLDVKSAFMKIYVVEKLDKTLRIEQVNLVNVEVRPLVEFYVGDHGVQEEAVVLM